MIKLKFHLSYSCARKRKTAGFCEFIATLLANCCCIVAAFVFVTFDNITWQYFTIVTLPNVAKWYQTLPVAGWKNIGLKSCNVEQSQNRNLRPFPCSFSSLHLFQFATFPLCDFYTLATVKVEKSRAGKAAKLKRRRCKFATFTPLQLSVAAFRNCTPIGN